MTFVETWYAVLERSHRYIPECRWPEGSQQAEIFSDLDDAVAHLDHLAEEGDGDRYDIYRIEPVGESARWDWQVVKPGEAPPERRSFVSEHAAQASRPGGYDLVKRRKGCTGPWTVVEAGGSAQ